jgi:hypothetical protein
MGIGDWGLGIGPNPQSPIPNPQSPIPIPNPQFFYLKKVKIKKSLNNYFFVKIINLSYLLY